MRVTHAVFDALRTFDRACSRAELEHETGLDTEEVRGALRVLKRHGVLNVDGGRCQLTTYRLKPHAPRPVDMRGHYDRSLQVPRHDGHLLVVGGQQRAAAGPPSHKSAPGAQRAAVSTASSRAVQAPAVSTCALAAFWRGTR